jgi:hypothetical protein
MSRLDSKNLPENIRKCMAKDVRKELKAYTNEEITENQARGEELEMHRQFQNWCQRRDVIFVHSRTDKKSTIKKGHPDFTLLWSGRGCCIEFKGKYGKLTDEQIRQVLRHNKAQVPICIATSLEDAIAFALENLGLSSAD